jgi:hypothetical protein
LPPRVGINNSPMLVMVLLITIRMVAGNPDRRRGAAGIAIGVVAALLGDQQSER